MEYVTLKVKVDSADAKLNIQSVRKAVTELQTVSSKPITISVNTSGANARIIRDVDDSMGQLNATSVRTGDTFTSLYAKIAKWGIMTSVVYGPIKAFREALTTLKAVDTEMVNVQKVTDYSSAQMQALEENAYALASAYGRTADEITAMYTTFARAGFLGDQLDSMTELGTLLANIGDISQDTASKFLLAVDAAWKLNGSESELMTVMDGLNEITNENAVDMEALTSGITVAGSVFAEAGESVQTFSALVGAGVAATQRSGSEISRGLRTIVMNIRQIKGETEDGELIDGESIAKASNALREYAGISTMANGQLRESSAVLSDLAGKWDTLDTVAQSAIAEALAGKRQANILTALMGNWDTVEKMMQDYADGAGSALRENEIYLDSWEAKSKQLTASWTEFVSHLVETDTIKGALDGVIGLVEFLDSDTGRLVVKVAALTAGVVALGNATKAALASETLKKFLSADIWKNLAQWFSWVSSGALSAGQSVSTLGQVLSQSLTSGLKTAGWMAIITLAIAGVNKGLQMMQEATDYLNRSFAEFDSDIKDANDSLEENRARLAEIAGMEDVWQTDEILEEKAALEEANAELEKQIENLGKVKVAKAKLMVGGEKASAAYVGGGTFLGGYRPGGGDAWESKAESAEAYLTAMQEATELTDAQRTSIENLLGAMDEMMAAYEALKDGGEKLTDAQQRELDAYYALKSAYERASGGAQAYIDALIDEARQSGATGKALYDLVAAQITASNTKLNLSQQIAALKALSVQAGYTAQDIATVYAYANGVGTYQADSAEVKKRAAELLNSGAASSVSQAFNLAKKQLTEEAWGNLTSNYTPSVSGGGYSGGGGSSSGESALRKKAQAEIDALKKARDAETAVIDEQIEALKKQNEETERGEKLEELKLNILKKQDALLNARNERTVRQYNAATGQWEWVADPSKVKKAEEDLEDAKKDLRDYEREVELDLAIEELEARKKAIEAAYQIKIDAWNDYLNGLADAVRREKELLEESKKNNQDNGTQCNRGNNNDTGQSNLDKWKDTKAGDIIGNVTGGTGSANLDKWKDTKAGDIIGNVTGGSSGKSNGIPSGTTAKDILEGGKKKQTGIPSGTTAKDILSGAGSKSNGSGSKVSQSDIERTAKGLVQTGKYKNYNEALKEAKRRAGVYDSGGVLRGMGGIKATMRDEIVLPPDITERLLKPSSEPVFRQRMDEMRCLLGMTPVSQSVAGSADNRSYTDHSGAEYHINGITMTQEQAERTPIAEIARMTHHLQAFGGR